MLPEKLQQKIKYGNNTSIAFLIIIMCCYSINFFAKYISDFLLFKHLAFVFIFIFMLCLITNLLNNIIVHKIRFNSGFILLFITSLAFFAIYLLVHKNIYFSDYLKLFLYFLIAINTYTLTKEFGESKKLSGYNLLVFIPFIILILDFFRPEIYHDHIGVSSIFYNSNNAAYYAIASSIFFLLNENKKLFWLFIGINLIIVVKLGGLVSILGALFLFNIKLLKKTKVLMLFLGFLIILFLVKDYFSVTVRLQNAVKSLIGLIDYYGIKEIPFINYGQAIGRIGEGHDLSFLFRIKQTVELILLYINGSFSEQLFGFGFRTIEQVTTAKLVAHNDFMTILFECGLIAFLIFLIPQLIFLFKIRKSYLFIPFCAIFIYFFIENLYFNFLATGLYFFLMAYVWAIHSFNVKVPYRIFQ